jgi:serralysin
MKMKWQEMTWSARVLTLVVFFIIIPILLLCFADQYMEVGAIKSRTKDIPDLDSILDAHARKLDPSLFSNKVTKDMELTFNENFDYLDLYLDKNGDSTCNPGGSGTWQTIRYPCERTEKPNNVAEVYVDKTFLDSFSKNATTTFKSKNPFSINNGTLTIEAAPADPAITSTMGSWAKYTSGVLTTQFSFSQQYGYFEIRTKLPAGMGLWPAFWLLPTDNTWPPEIDVLESFGEKNYKGEGGHTLAHYASFPVNLDGKCGAWYDVGTDITEDFHTYGVDWEANGLTYYFDGQPYAKCPPNPDANKPFYMIVNLAVGDYNSWPGPSGRGNVWPAKMDIDYIRAYQKIK